MEDHGVESGIKENQHIFIEAVSECKRKLVVMTCTTANSYAVMLMNLANFIRRLLTG